jgi:hypothetical protein
LLRRRQKNLVQPTLLPKNQHRKLLLKLRLKQKQKQKLPPMLPLMRIRTKQPQQKRPQVCILY